MVFMFPPFIPAHGMFYCFVGCKIHCVCRTCLICYQQPKGKGRIYRPAPKTTLDKPLHSVLKPSTLDIVTIALDMPVYTAVGEGLTTCILVLQVFVVREIRQWN